jgi:SAM-dependent methyltransferase
MAATVASAEMSEYDAFAAFYDEWASVMTEDVPYYVELARESDGPLVELGVGNGRVAIPVARETLRKVIGIDVSPAMLEQARGRAEAAGVELELREQDMRELELDEPVGLIYSPFRSLLHLPSWGDRRRVFERVAASLRPGGRFAWNAFVFSPWVAVEMHDQEQPHSEGSEIRAVAHHVPQDNRIDINAWKGDHRMETSIWWLTRSEWEGLIDTAGLEVEALYGWFDRSPFDEQSPEFVWVTRKPS